MEYWREKAFEYFPEFEERLTDVNEGPMALWIDLSFALADAYKQTPINEDMIRRIYDYAAWCFRQPPGTDIETDLSTAVSVAFVEDLPLDERVSADLHRWISIETFEGCESLMRYHLTDEQYRRLRDDFLRKK